MEKLMLLLALMLLCTAAFAKEGRTYYDDALVGRVREKLARHDWARQQAEGIRASAAWLLEMSDEELWNFVPPPEQIRAINVCIAHDCPICGDEVNRRAGHYPWIHSRERPFKVKCPVCSTEFPSNDFQPWNLGGLKGAPETGPGYVDKGLGWQAPDGRRYYFVPYYIFWQRWVRDVLGSMASLSQAYVLTDEPAYARKCAILLARVAADYDRFDYANQAYHEGIIGTRGRISDYIWSTGNNTTMALAYDAVYPALSADRELLAFLKAKGVDDPRTHIERKLLHPMVRDVMSGFVAGNMGMHQTTLCNLAIVLDNDDPAKGPTTAEMRDWLMRGGGRVEDILWNGFRREGLGAESAPGYSSGWGVYFYEVAELLPKLGVDIWSIPKLKKMADIGLDLTVAGQFCPSTGDSGSSQGCGLVAWSAALQGIAFSHYKDPRHAQALARIKATSRSLFRDYFDEEEVARVAAAQGTGFGWKTRDLGGYGLAILESGEGEHRRGLSLYYGDASGGHGHADRLNIEMFSHGQSVLPDDGYPTPFTRPDFHQWRRADTFRHYCVMVDELPQLTYEGGRLNSLVSAPGVQFVDASAEAAYPELVSFYRRTTALVDISPEASYLLDIFRVRGGSQHDWCFHGPLFPEFATAGGEFGPAHARGTLAGEDVAYGAKPATLKQGVSSGFQGLRSPRRMTPIGAWSATWRRPDDGLAVTMTMPAGCAGEVIQAEGEPEAQKGNPRAIPYLLARNRGPAGEALLSCYAAVVEPHQGPAEVTAVERLEPVDVATTDVGLVVRRGRETDLVHSSLDPKAARAWRFGNKRLEVTGEFALITLDRRGVRRACLVNGTVARLGEFVLHASPPTTGKIARVDFQGNTVSLDRVFTRPDLYRDRVAIFENERHSTSYMIREARVEGDRTVLQFGDALFVVGMGHVAQADRAAGTITSAEALAGYGRIDGGRHAGRWVYNEARTRGFRILEVEKNTLRLESAGADLDALFTDADGDGRRRYWISDVGPGDRVRIPSAVSVTRE